MSLIVVFNMHRGGVATHSQCAGWNLTYLIEPRKVRGKYI